MLVIEIENEEWEKGSESEWQKRAFNNEKSNFIYWISFVHWRVKASVQPGPLGTFSSFVWLVEFTLFFSFRSILPRHFISLTTIPITDL